MKRDEFERAPAPIATRYFPRADLEATWAAIRPLDSDQTLDQAMAWPVMATIIRCAALGKKRAEQAIANYGSLRPPRDAEVAQHVLARRLGARKRPARPDVKQRQANDIDLFDPVETA